MLIALCKCVPTELFLKIVWSEHPLPDSEKQKNRSLSHQLTNRNNLLPISMLIALCKCVPTELFLKIVWSEHPLPDSEKQKNRSLSHQLTNRNNRAERLLFPLTRHY